MADPQAPDVAALLTAMGYKPTTQDAAEVAVRLGALLDGLAKLAPDKPKVRRRRTHGSA